jgi:glutamate/tyrosine decarboxylase-like PLP-dependent enzyme
MVWAVLREIGRAGVAARVEGHVALARALADRVAAHPRLELLMEPELSVVLFRYVRSAVGVDVDALNADIVTELRRATRFIPSSTTVDGNFAIRPCFINPRQTMVEVDGLLDAVVTVGDRLSA